MPSAHTRWGAQPAISRSRRRIEPPSGTRAPVIRLKSVVLPDPLGPMTPISSPSATADRKSTRLNSSHLVISYAVFCLKKKKENKNQEEGTRKRSSRARVRTVQPRQNAGSGGQVRRGALHVTARATV